MRRVVAAAVGGALLLPVALDRDDFPLSTYPMYSRTRDRTVRFTTAFAVVGDERPEPLGLETIGGVDDPLLVVGELRAAVRAGRAEERCAEIAARAGRAGVPAGSTVEVVTEHHDVIDRVEGDASLVDREVHATCTVPATAFTEGRS